MQTAMRHAKPSPSLLDRPSVYSTTPYNTSIQRQFKYIGGSVMAVTKHNFRKPDRFSMWPCFSQVNNHAANTTAPFRKTTQIVGMCEWLIHRVVRPSSACPSTFWSIFLGYSRMQTVCNKQLPNVKTCTERQIQTATNTSNKRDERRRLWNRPPLAKSSSRRFICPSEIWPDRWDHIFRSHTENRKINRNGKRCGEDEKCANTYDFVHTYN